jgi:uncharacterized repeat protein (TIGR03803 family)
MGVFITQSLRHIRAGCIVASLSAATGVAHAASERVLYSFQGGRDGSDPIAGLIEIGGNLYGTTSSGGPGGYGTIFKVTLRGVETVVYSFNDSNGAVPEAGVTKLSDKLYGTTQSGGNGSNYGTLFCVTRFGEEKWSRSFAFSDGASPQYGSLIGPAGTFYGTTAGGGANAYGTVFSVTQHGNEKVLYSFKGFAQGDGQSPLGGLVQGALGLLYGTTSGGGAAGNGTVFSVGTDGTEQVVYAFKGGGDAAIPTASLIWLRHGLYGTTAGGGTYGNGTVFHVTTAGKENVLHSFQGGYDGAYPGAALVEFDGALYGTTPEGGIDDLGTVFKVTRDGTETVVYSFKGTFNSGDAAVPESNLIEVDGTLYGTTAGGGTYGNGTVFALTP